MLLREYLSVNDKYWFSDQYPSLFSRCELRKRLYIWMVSQVCPAKPGDRERQEWLPEPPLGGQPTPLSGWLAAHSGHQPAPPLHMIEKRMPQTRREPEPSSCPPPAPAGALEGSSTSGSEHSILYLNIEQVQLHGVSRVHILIRVKELPSKQQCFIFIYSLFSECSAVIQPIYCKARWHMKELCLLFLFSSRGLSKTAAWGKCGFLKCSYSVIVAS